MKCHETLELIFFVFGNPEPETSYHDVIQSKWTKFGIDTTFLLKIFNKRETATSLRQEVSPSFSLPPGVTSAALTFDQLKSAYTHENIVKDLGKLGAEDPHKQSSLAYANLRENRSARRHLAGLNLARGHI